METSEALSLFADPDEERAQVGYQRLCEEARPFLHRYLARWLVDPNDRDDVIQESLLRLWMFRPRFQNQGVAAWYALLKRVADRCHLDFRQKHRRTILSEDLDLPELADEDLPILEGLLTGAIVAELYVLANTLWLGLDPALSPDTHTRQLLAAQLYYLDGEPWDRVLRLLDPTAPEAAPLTRAVLDAWLSDEGVLRYLAYVAIYYSNDRLAAHLLGRREPVSAADLDELARRATAAGSEEAAGSGWTGSEVAVLLWRYRHALLIEQIAAREDCPFDRAQLEALLERSVARLPFKEQMATLLARLAAGCVARAPAILANRGLWQRLAFQYRYQEELPNRDIQARIEPAAALVGYELTAGMLNMWLSGGRLLQQLAGAWARSGGESRPRG